MSKEKALKKLEKTTFFNKKWSEEKVIDALNYGYQKAISKGITDGNYNFKYKGEKITVNLKDGNFHTGFGYNEYSYEELLKMAKH